MSLKGDDTADFDCVHVPLTMYQKLQQDPLIYIASESLADAAVLTYWHLAFITVSTMAGVWCFMQLRVYICG